MPKASAAKPETLYAVHPGIVMVRKWMAELKEKTGRSADEWVVFVKSEGPKDAKARLEWLKTKHKLGTNGARWIADRVDGRSDETSDPEVYLEAAARYVEDQYVGPKEKLRPLYDELLSLGKTLGGDVKACPCKTMVPLYCQHVFAQIKPATNTRVDLGLALASYKGKLPKRLIDTGGLAKKDRITHRIEISHADQIDDEARRWLKIAYDLDGAETRTKLAPGKFY